MKLIGHTKKSWMRGIVRKRGTGRVGDAENGAGKRTKKQMMRGIVRKKMGRKSGRGREWCGKVYEEADDERNRT